MSAISAQGSLHHVAYVVTDADSAAASYERMWNWRRIMDTTRSGEDARIGGALLGLEGVTRMRVVMVEPPMRGGTQLEFVSISTDTGSSHVGVSLLSVTVTDARSTWADLTADGITAVLPPTDVVVGGWPLTVASYRTTSGELVELIEFRR